MTLKSADWDGPSTVERSDVTVSLLGGFSLWDDGDRVAALAVGSQRLLALLALRDRPVSRITIAGTLWPDVTGQHAADSLRSALGRLGSVLRAGLVDEDEGLRLDEAVRIDYTDARDLAHRLLDSDTPIFDGDLAASAIATLSRELLPGWVDDWVTIEGEEWRHLRTTALEALAGRLLAAQRLPEAEGAVRAAMRVDPLRETPHATLIRIHLADGNQSDAIAAFESYRALLRLALDLEPTTRLTDLLLPMREHAE